MAAYRRVYDSRHPQADCQGPGSAAEPYAQQSSMGYLYLQAWLYIERVTSGVDAVLRCCWVVPGSLDASLSASSCRRRCCSCSARRRSSAMRRCVSARLAACSRSSSSALGSFGSDSRFSCRNALACAAIICCRRTCVGVSGSALS